jgi:HAD superfamily hydrolase (TIGR02253 family)
MLKAIFFDLDDTLLDAQTPYREAIAATCAEAGRRCASLDPKRLSAIYLEVAREMWRSFDLDLMRESADEIRERVWAEALRQIGVDDVALVRELSDHYGAARKASHRLFPDVLSTLDRLHRRYHLGIITNGMTEIQQDKIQRLGLAPYFDTVLISQEAGMRKPDPRLFRMALACVPCESHEAVMVGDSPDRDIAGARAVGMHALWVRTGPPRDPTPAPGVAPPPGVAPLLSPERRGEFESVSGPTPSSSRRRQEPEFALALSPPSPPRGQERSDARGGGEVPQPHAILERLGELLPWLERLSPSPAPQ